MFVLLLHILLLRPCFVRGIYNRKEEEVDNLGEGYRKEREILFLRVFG